MAHHLNQTSKTKTNTKLDLSHDFPSQDQRFSVPSKLTQIYFSEQTCDLTSKKSRRADEDKKKQKFWTEEEHLKLCQIFTARGLRWHDLVRQFQKRQKAEIKQHFFVSLKKIFQQFALFKRNDMTSDTSKTDFRFIQLRSMTKYIGSHRHRSEQFCMKNRKVIGDLLAAHLPNINKKCKQYCQEIQKLRQALLHFRKLLQQKDSKRQFEHKLEKMVPNQHIDLELGYQSDFQSAFSENLLPDFQKQIVNCNHSQQNNQSQNQSLQIINQNVIIEENKDKIKALLLRQGILLYTNQSNQERESFGVPSIGSECDMLDNESYQNFCSCHFIPDQQDELRVENRWRRTLCGTSSQQQV